MNMNKQAAAQALVDAGQRFDARGWVPASSGNFSVRLSADRFAITASGRHKGELTAADILTIDMQGQVLEGAGKPSYETGLHTQLYARQANVGAVLHTHSACATVLSRLVTQDIELQGYELLKIFDGIDTHDICMRIPIYDNDQNIAALAARIDADMERDGMGHAYLIRGHGIYTWAPDITTARYRVEALEFMLECEALERLGARK